MIKVNIGLFGILITIILILFCFFFFKNEQQKISDELNTIKIYLEDLDEDIHNIEEKLKWIKFLVDTLDLNKPQTKILLNISLKKKN
mgnify:CR=1 FL=1